MNIKTEKKTIQKIKVLFFVLFIFFISAASLTAIEVFRIQLLNSLPNNFQALITIVAASMTIACLAYYVIIKNLKLKSFVHEVYDEKKRLSEKYVESQLEFEKQVEERNSELSEINELLNLEIESRKKTEELLRDSERKYKLIYKHTPVGIFHYDKTLTINDFNEKFISIFNGSRESLINLDFNNFNDTNLTTALQSGLSGNEGKFKGDIFIPESGKYNISLTTAPLYDTANKIDGGLGIVESGIENSEINFKIREREIESEKLKTEFLAQVTHEIRSPVHVILSFSDMLKARLGSNISEEYSTSLEMISKAGNRITRTLEIIIYMAEIQAGTYKYLPRFIDLYNDILMRIYYNYRRIAEEKRIELTIEKKTDATFIQVDENTIYQIFNNILDNAVKYTKSGSIKINVSNDGYNCLTVSVSDTGIGIAEDYLPYIFKSFSQEDKGYSRGYEGSGLGLSLVKKCCELNNLSIEVESIKGIGSTFIVRFGK
jgi:signal transduction histidine kinase